MDSSQGIASTSKLNLATSSKTIVIDSRGDVTLIIGEKQVGFVVCSRALARSSRYWETLLYGNFMEKKPTDGSPWIVTFPEEEPSGFEILLLLVHGQAHKISNIDLNTAFNVTVLTNMYDMSTCLRACARDWLQHLKPQAF